MFPLSMHSPTYGLLLFSPHHPSTIAVVPCILFAGCLDSIGCLSIAKDIATLVHRAPSRRRTCDVFDVAMAEEHVREGDTVVVDHGHDKKRTLLVASARAKLKVGGSWVSAERIVGARFGTRFEARGGALELSFGSACTGWESQLVDLAMAKVEKDNRSIVDDGTAQALSKDDIDALQKDGWLGTALVEKIIENSATYGKKTEFAQEKYKNKKMKKHAAAVVVRRPTAAAICEVCFLGKAAPRTHFMRDDTLSLLLSMANIGAHAKVLVLDQCGGLVAGAVAERLGGHGEMVVGYFGHATPPLDLLKSFNFEDDVWNTIFHASMDRFDARPTEVEPAETEAPAPEVEPRAEATRPMDEPTPPPVEEKKKQRKASRASDEQIQEWKRAKFDSLVVAAPNLDQAEAMTRILPLVIDSGNFAIYSNFSQPLAECLHHLRSRRMAVDVELGEPWLREYQVLPGRTHPHMNTEGTGGFVLSGIKVQESSPTLCTDASKRLKTSP